MNRMEEEIAGFTGPALFDSACKNTEAEKMWERSFRAEEEHEKRLHTVKEMRNYAFDNFSAEGILLGKAGDDLCQRMLHRAGYAVMKTDDEFYAGYGMMKRLWAVPVENVDGGIRIPRELWLAIIFMNSEPNAKAYKNRAQKVYDTAANTLYLSGVLNAKVVVEDLLYQFRKASFEVTEEMCRTALKCHFQTFHNHRGELMLAHDALYDPWEFARRVDRGGLNMDPKALSKLYKSIIKMEDPLLEALTKALESVIRPGMSASETAEDVLLLAKQSAPIEGLREVINRRIVCLSTKEIDEALTELYEKVPRWDNLSMLTLQ